nr:FkbM family methyltransferase [uncultured Chloroflexota bacterium]
MYLPPEWRGVAKLLFVFRDKYEPELAVLEKFLAPGGVMVDVGANYGIYSLYASQIVGEHGRVIAFEPAKKTFHVLQKNVLLNAASNVVCIQAAISNQPGKITLYHHPDPSRNSLAKSDDWNKSSEVVYADTLDAMLARYGITRADFVKVDTEGAEELVFWGGQEILRTSKPVILFEHNPLASSQMGLKPEGSWQVLSGLGYSFFVWSDGVLRPVSINDVVGGNVLAIHSSAEHRA